MSVVLLPDTVAVEVTLRPPATVLPVGTIVAVLLMVVPTDTPELTATVMVRVADELAATLAVAVTEPPEPDGDDVIVQLDPLLE